MAIEEDRSELYSALSGEPELLKKVRHFERRLTALETALAPFAEAGDLYQGLSTEEKVQYDIFLSYSLTSLFWMYTRTRGEEPSEHPVKDEVQRVQEYMKMYHNIKERKSAPKLDSAAAKRFVRSGLFDLKNIKQGKRKVFDVVDSDGEEESGSPEKRQAVSTD